VGGLNNLIYHDQQYSDHITTPLTTGAKEALYYQRNFPGWRNLVAMAAAWKCLRKQKSNTPEHSTLINSPFATEDEFFRGVLLFTRKRHATAGFSPHELASALISLFPGRFLGWDGERASYIKWTANRILRVVPGTYPEAVVGFMGKKTPAGGIPEPELFDKKASVKWLAGVCLSIRRSDPTSGAGG
jgi:hypothetical protein